MNASIQELTAALEQLAHRDQPGIGERPALPQELDARDLRPAQEVEEFLAHRREYSAKARNALVSAF